MLITMVPIAAELIMVKSPMYGNYDDNADLYKEVSKKSEDRKKSKIAENKE